MIIIDLAYPRPHKSITFCYWFVTQNLNNPKGVTELKPLKNHEQ